MQEFRFVRFSTPLATCSIFDDLSEEDFWLNGTLDDILFVFIRLEYAMRCTRTTSCEFSTRRLEVAMNIKVACSLTKQLSFIMLANLPQLAMTRLMGDDLHCICTRLDCFSPHKRGHLPIESTVQSTKVLHNAQDLMKHDIHETASLPIALESLAGARGELLTDEQPSILQLSKCAQCAPAFPSLGSSIAKFTACSMLYTFSCEDHCG